MFSTVKHSIRSVKYRREIVTAIKLWQSQAQDENPVCRLCNEEEETTFLTVFESEVLAHPQFNLLRLTNPGEEIPKKNLVNSFLDLIKGSNLLTQE
jgi:hypothetical protein